MKRAARIRLEMASDRLARQLLNMTTDPNVADLVKLAAIKDALDRSGIQAKTAVTVDVSVKPFERVFDRIVAGPRSERQTAPAIERGIVDEVTDKPVSESENDVIVGEFDDDVIEDDLPRFQQHRESVDVIDVEIDAGYTDVDAGIMKGDGSGTATPDADDSSASGPLSPDVGPLGMNGPVGSGLMSLSDAVEAAAEMRARQAVRMRDMRRR